MGKHMVVVARAIRLKTALAHLIVEQDVAHHKQVYVHRAVCGLAGSRGTICATLALRELRRISASRSLTICRVAALVARTQKEEGQYACDHQHDHDDYYGKRRATLGRLTMHVRRMRGPLLTRLRP